MVLMFDDAEEAHQNDAVRGPDRLRPGKQQF